MKAPTYFDPMEANNLFLDGAYKRAFAEYTRGLNEFHSPICAFNLATMHQLGLGVPRDTQKAANLYEACASLLGDGDAEYNLALLILRRQCTHPDERFDRNNPGFLRQCGMLMETAAEKGCVHAKYYLGVSHLLGRVFDPLNIECIARIPFPRIVPRNEQTLPLLADPTGQLPGADLIDYDTDEQVILDQDQELANTYFEKAHNADDTYAESVVGDALIAHAQLLLEGDAASYGDRARAFRLMERAAAQYGSADAAAFLLEHKEEAAEYRIAAGKYEHLRMPVNEYFRSRYLIPAPPTDEE